MEELAKLKKDTSIFLRSFSLGQCTKKDVFTFFKKWLEKDKDNKYKTTIHLILFAHIDHPYIIDILDNSGCMSLEDIDFDIVAVAPLNYDGIDASFYCECIVQFELWSQCHQTLEVLANEDLKKFITNHIESSVTEKLSYRDFDATIVPNVEHFIAILVDLTRSTANENEMDFYKKKCILLLNTYVAHQCIKKPRKIMLLLKLIGVALCTPADFEDASEFTELANERKYYPLKSDDHVTRRSVQAFLKTKVLTRGNVAPIVLERIVTQLVKFEITAEERLEWTNRETVTTTSNSVLRNIGGLAHLTDILLKKYEDQLEADMLEKTSNFLNQWINYKPKLSFQDFQDEITCFKEFCELLSVHGKRKRYQRDWLLEFVKYDEIFDHKISLQLIDKLVVPYGDFEVVSTIVKKALDVDCELSMRAKELILKLLIKNPNVRSDREKLVSIIFEDGNHSLFTLHYFNLELNNICAKIGTIEKEKDPKKINYWEDLLFRLCVQNPSESLLSILQQTLRSRQTRVLQFATPFLNILMDKLTPNRTVMMDCLQKILSKTSPYDTSFSFIVGCISEICPKFVKYEHLYEMIKTLIQDSMGTPEFPKVLKFLDVFDTIVHASETNIDFEDWSVFLLRQVVATYNELSGEKYKEILQVRQKCLQMLDQCHSPMDHFRLNSASIQDESLDLPDLALLFIRCPANRDEITTIIKSRGNYDVDYIKMLRLTILLVLNSNEKEWLGLIKFCDFVVREIMITEDKDCTLLQVVNDAVVEAIYILGIDTVWAPLFSHCVSFYTYFCDFKGDHGFEHSSSDRVLMMETLLKLVIAMDTELREINETKEQHQQMTLDSSFYQSVFLDMLDVVDWLAINDPLWNTKTARHCADLVLSIPSQIYNLTPITHAIFFKVVNSNDVSMLSMFPIHNKVTDKKLTSIQENLDAYYSSSA